MSNFITISIAKDFSDAPGARYKDDGPDSGEEFFEKILKLYFHDALINKKKLKVDMDGTYGYATSFISEAFGRLSKEFGSDLVLANIEIKSEEDPSLIQYVIKTIENPDA